MPAISGAESGRHWDLGHERAGGCSQVEPHEARVTQDAATPGIPGRERGYSPKP